MIYLFRFCAQIFFAFIPSLTMTVYITVLAVFCSSLHLFSFFSYVFHPNYF